MARLENRELPIAVHVRACIAPILAASIRFGISLADVPRRGGFGVAPLCGDINPKRHSPISFAAAYHDPIGVLRRRHTTRKSRKQDNGQNFT